MSHCGNLFSTSHLSLRTLITAAFLTGVSTTSFGQTYPRPNKTVHIMMENSTYQHVLGVTDPRTGAPYINSLRPIAANMTKSVGLFHPTYRNYNCIFSGSTQGITSNTDPRDLVGGAQLTTPNLAAALLARGYTFGNYATGLGTNTNPPFSINAPDGSFILGENIPQYWIGTGKNQIPASCMQDISKIPADFSKLPTVSFWHVVECHDMHQGFPNEKITDGDNWIRDIVSNYVQWAMKNNALLIISFDESYSSYEDPALWNHIPTLFVGPMVRPGDYDQPISHYNVLRTMERLYGVSNSGACTEITSGRTLPPVGPISTIWKASTSETPIVSVESPANFDNLEAPADITLTASVIPKGHTIDKVAYYNGSTLIGEATTAPYSLPWSAVPAASHGHTVYAKVYYDGLATPYSSAPVHFGVWPASRPLTDGLVAYLDFERNLNGGGGAPINGTAFPAGRVPHYVPGKIGWAADFMNNGSSSASASDWAVSLGNLDSVYDGDFTYSCWVKTSSTGNTAVMGNKNWASGANTGWMFSTNYSAKTFNWNAASGNRHDVGVNPPISDGAWHMLTFTVNRTGNRVVCYYDGKQYNESTVSSNNGAASLSAGFETMIGASGPGTFGATCSVDDAGIWSRMLNPNEIATIYANGMAGKSMLGVTPPPPVADLTSNLVVYLKGDGNLSPSGGTAVAATAVTGNSLTAGTARYTAGKFGQALSFLNNGSTTTGPSDWAASLGNLESVYSGDFSLSFWVRTATTVNGALMGNKNWVSGANVGWVTSTFSSQNKNFNWNAPSGTRRDVGVPGYIDGTWHHVAITVDRTANRVICYCDGAPISTAMNNISPSGTGSFNAGYDTLIGSSGNGKVSGTGDLDDIALWSRALSAFEIKTISEKGQAGQPLLP